MPCMRSAFQIENTVSSKTLNMEVIRSVQSMRELRSNQSLAAPTGLVPTMGDLHAGHLALVEHCQQHCESTIVTIFVNPLQFGANEDFSSYPRVLERDIEKLTEMSVDVVFAPTNEDMYPEGQDNVTRVSVPEISLILCGAARPGHFDGVTTVVSKLLHVTLPDIAFFGEKDWQQLTIIKRMVRQLDFPVEIQGVPTVRESDGLALSSRNRYLSTEERKLAPGLFTTLREVATQLKEGSTDYSSMEHAACQQLTTLGFLPDYVAIRTPENLEVPSAKDESLRIFGAARLGRARLIDNIGIVR